MQGIGSSDRDYRDFLARSFGPFVQSLFRNAVERITGQPVHHGKIGAFWRRHLRHILRRRPISVLTNGHYIKREGGGSRALMTMYAIAYCRRFGIPYRHTPMTGVHHAEGAQDAWDRRWESFFNLGLGEEPVAGRESETFDLFLLTFIKQPGGEDLTRFIRPPLPAFRPIYYFVFAELPDGHLRRLFEQLFVDLLQPVIPEFKARYRHGKPPREPAEFTVAMHVRRGDVGPDRGDMWTDLASFRRTLADVRQALAACGVAHRILVFSQGQQEDFAEFAGPGVTFHLDADPFWTLQSMIEADLLVMSKSSFSYVAALLGDGLCLYEPCQIPPLEHWIVRDPDGGVDQQVLEQRIGWHLSESGGRDAVQASAETGG